jgi:hypothetical protein
MKYGENKAHDQGICIEKSKVERWIERLLTSWLRKASGIYEHPLLLPILLLPPLE